MERIAIVLTPEGGMGRLSVVEFRNELWLVTKWMTHKTKPLKRPERVIRLSGLQFEKADPQHHGADYMVNEPIPRAILDGVVPAELSGKFVVLDKPNVEFPTSSTH